jgi:hypothetical protein
MKINPDFWIGLTFPIVFAIIIKVWEFTAQGNTRNRDVMQKILLQLERHEVLFSEMQKDIHELRGKF